MNKKKSKNGEERKTGENKIGKLSGSEIWQFTG